MKSQNPSAVIIIALLLITFAIISCKKKKQEPITVEPEPAPVYNKGYIFRISEYQPRTDIGVGSQDSVSYRVTSGDKTLINILFKQTISGYPLNLASQDSLKNGDVVECITTAFIRKLPASICTFKCDSTWIEGKNYINKLKGTDTYTAPVTYVNGRAVVIWKRQYVIN